MHALRWMLSGSLLAIMSCHSDSHEPSSAEATQGGDEPYFGTPDGTIGPNVGTGAPAPQPGGGVAPSDDTLGTPPDIAGHGGIGGTGGTGGSGGAGGM